MLRSPLLPIALVAILALTACGGGGAGSDRDSDRDDDSSSKSVLEDDLDLDSYAVAGTIDGLEWTGDLCALNLIPSFAAYFEGKADPFYVMQFEAYDSDIDAGVVTGIWRLDGNVDHVVQIDHGTWMAATADTGDKPGTISVDLEVTEYFPEGGSTKRTVSGALNLTPVVTSDECVSMNDVDSLKDFLKTYEGPTGGGL